MIASNENPENNKQHTYIQMGLIVSEVVLWSLSIDGLTHQHNHQEVEHCRGIHAVESVFMPIKIIRTEFFS